MIASKFVMSTCYVCDQTYVKMCLPSIQFLLRPYKEKIIKSVTKKIITCEYWNECDAVKILLNTSREIFLCSLCFLLDWQECMSSQASVQHKHFIPWCTYNINSTLVHFLYTCLLLVHLVIINFLHKLICQVERIGHWNLSPDWICRDHMSAPFWPLSNNTTASVCSSLRCSLDEVRRIFFAGVALYLFG